MGLCVTCKCGASILNSGHRCSPLFEVAAIIVAVPTFNSLGVKNSIPLASVLNQGFFDALTNETDETKRWRPFPLMKNIEDIRADATFFDFDDNSTEFVHEGSRQFKGLIASTSGKGAVAPEMKRIIESARCVETSVYIITTGNQLAGKLSADGLSLEPLQIDEQSIYANFIKATNEQGQHIMLQFNFAASEKDENLDMFDCSELGDADLLGLKGLLDISSEVISSSTTDIKIKLKSNFGTPLTPVIVQGLLVADFVSSDSGATSSLFNETTQLDVAITGFVESPNGTYELTFAAQNSADVIVIKPLKDGFDFTEVEKNPVSIP